MVEKKEEKSKKKKTSKEEKVEKKPVKKKVSASDYEKAVLELAEKGFTSDKIGEGLRKQGIHPKEQSKKISDILKEKGKYTDPHMKSVEEKLERVKTHYDKNKQDKRAMRERDRLASKIRKLKKYFKISK